MYGKRNRKIVTLCCHKETPLENDVGSADGTYQGRGQKVIREKDISEQSRKAFSTMEFIYSSACSAEFRLHLVLAVWLRRFPIVAKAHRYRRLNLNNAGITTTLFWTRSRVKRIIQYRYLIGNRCTVVSYTVFCGNSFRHGSIILHWSLVSTEYLQRTFFMLRAGSSLSQSRRVSHLTWRNQDRGPAGYKFFLLSIFQVDSNAYSLLTIDCYL